MSETDNDVSTSAERIVEQKQNTITAVNSSRNSDHSKILWGPHEIP